MTEIKRRGRPRKPDHELARPRPGSKKEAMKLIQAPGKNELPVAVEVAQKIEDPTQKWVFERLIRFQNSCNDRFDAEAREIFGLNMPLPKMELFSASGELIRERDGKYDNELATLCSLLEMAIRQKLAVDAAREKCAEIQAEIDDFERRISMRKNQLAEEVARLVTDDNAMPTGGGALSYAIEQLEKMRDSKRDELAAVGLQNMISQLGNYERELSAAQFSLEHKHYKNRITVVENYLTGQLKKFAAFSNSRGARSTYHQFSLILRNAIANNGVIDGINNWGK